MTSRPVRVIKLGGSLLDWPELVGQFRCWLATQPPAANVIVVGGGPLVDSLRALDRIHALSDETAHWLAIRAMSLTSAIVAELLSEATLVRSPEELRLESAGPPQILDVEEFLRKEHRGNGALPCSWDVTSDSIAARLANVLDAGELVLLKSALPADATYKSAAQGGYVDARFAASACLLSVRCVNLRDRQFAEFTLAVDHTLT
ncbi:MAG: hypothetical protein WDZ48_04450 [Pirellulales bacterium]